MAGGGVDSHEGRGGGPRLTETGSPEVTAELWALTPVHLFRKPVFVLGLVTFIRRLLSKKT